MCNSDTILDSGATQSIFPLNYRHLTEFKKDSSYAVMADQTSKLTLYGSAKYGCFDVLVTDINRPLLSEGAITGPPYNLTVLKSGVNAWILDPSKTSKDSNWILCHCTKEFDNLYHIHNPTRLLSFKPPVQFLQLNLPVIVN